MTSQVIFARCSGCNLTHPDTKSAKICGASHRPFWNIDEDLDKLVNGLVDDTYKSLSVTPLTRHVTYSFLSPDEYYRKQDNGRTTD